MAFNANYLWSRLSGNFSGLSQSDEDGRVSPNVGRLYDYPITLFSQDGQPMLGPLATDRPHQVKALVIYETGVGMNLGAFLFAASGIPVSRVATVMPPNNYPVQYLGRLSDGRTPFLSQTDFYVQQDIRLRGHSKLSLGFSVTNLFDHDTVISKYLIENLQGIGLTLNKGDYYAGRVDIQQLFVPACDRLNIKCGNMPDIRGVLDMYYPDLRLMFESALKAESQYYKDLKARVVRLCEDRAIPVRVVYERVLATSSSSFFLAPPRMSLPCV